MTDEIKEVVSIMKDLFSSLDTKIEKLDTKMENGFREVKERIVKIETTQENVTNKNIQLLAEGFSAVTDKLQLFDEMKEDLSSLKDDMTLVKTAVGAHSVEINKLAKVK